MSTGGAELPFSTACKAENECIVVKISIATAKAANTCTVEVKQHVGFQSWRQAPIQYVCALLHQTCRRQHIDRHESGSSILYHWAEDIIWLDTYHTSLFCNSSRHDAFSCSSQAQCPSRSAVPRQPGQNQIAKPFAGANMEALPTPALSQTTYLHRTDFLLMAKWIWQTCQI